MLRRIKNFILARPYIFDRIYPLYTRLNLRRRQLLKEITFGGSLMSVEEGSTQIQNAILNNEAVAIGKIGTSELMALRYANRGKPLDANLEHLLFNCAGFFPFEPKPVQRFQKYFGEVLGGMTHIAVWGNVGEAQMIKQHARSSCLLDRRTLEPHKVLNPWTSALQGKRIVVVSPFDRSIKNQYPKRKEIWKGKPEILPDFELRTVRAPLHPILVEPEESDWFERLDRVWSEVCAEEFDVCLVGAGGMSLPIVVRCAEIGKVGIHMGGLTQIQFGIWGSRWDHDPVLSTLKNSSWVSPLDEETPDNANLADNHSYW